MQLPKCCPPLATSALKVLWQPEKTLLSSQTYLIYFPREPKPHGAAFASSARPDEHKGIEQAEQQAPAPACLGSPGASFESPHLPPWLPPGLLSSPAYLGREDKPEARPVPGLDQLLLMDKPCLLQLLPKIKRRGADILLGLSTPELPPAPSSGQRYPRGNAERAQGSISSLASTGIQGPRPHTTGTTCGGVLRLT